MQVTIRRRYPETTTEPEVIGVETVPDVVEMEAIIPLNGAGTYRIVMNSHGLDYQYLVDGKVHSRGKFTHQGMYLSYRPDSQLHPKPVITHRTGVRFRMR